MRRTTISTHPEIDELTAFAQGNALPDDRTEAIASHVTTCADCRQVIADAAPDPFVRSLQAAAGAEEVIRRQRLVEGYEVLDQLGEGGSGVVYRARQPGLDRIVALKLLRSRETASSVELQRWRRETRTLAALDHRHIVKIHDAGEQAGAPYLAMELVDGLTLAQRLASGPLADREAAELVCVLAEAMQFAHQRGIIHRDLKPQNILLPAEVVEHPRRPEAEPAHPVSLNQAKIADFGLSRWLLEAGQTCTGDPLGTPSYMAPEQVRGASDQICAATDVYGLGAILYECVTGRPPYRGASALETMQLVLHREPPSIHRQRAAIARDLDAICMRCLEKEPKRRYATAAELRDDLQRFLHGRPVIARKPGPIRQTRMWVTRNPWLASCIALLIVTPLCATAALIWHNRSIEQQRQLAHEHYAEARATIWEMLGAARSHTSLEIPKLSEMAMRQAETALALFERLADEEHTPESALELSRIRLELGSAYVALGQTERGSELFALAVQDLERLQKTELDSSTLVTDAMTAKIKLAVAWTEQKRYADAQAILDQAVQLGQGLVKQNPQDVHSLNGLGWAHHALANNYWHMHDLSHAVEHYMESINYREQALVRDPHNAELAELTLGSRLNLAQARGQQGEVELARDEMRRAVSDIDQLIAQGRSSVELLVSRGTLLLNLSNMLAALEGPEAAIEACHDGIESVQAAHQAEPSHLGARDILFRLHGNRGMYRMQCGQESAAVDDWWQAIEMAPDDELRLYCRTMQIRCLAMAGQLGAAAELAEICEAGELSAANWFRVSAVWGFLAHQTREEHPSATLTYGLQSLRSLGKALIGEPLLASPERQQLFESSDDFWATRELLALLIPPVCPT